MNNIHPTNDEIRINDKFYARLLEPGGAWVRVTVQAGLEDGSGWIVKMPCYLIGYDDQMTKRPEHLYKQPLFVGEEGVDFRTLPKVEGEEQRCQCPDGRILSGC